MMERLPLKDAAISLTVFLVHIFWNTWLLIISKRNRMNPSHKCNLEVCKLLDCPRLFQMRSNDGTVSQGCSIPGRMEGNLIYFDIPCNYALEQMAADYMKEQVNAIPS